MDKCPYLMSTCFVGMVCEQFVTNVYRQEVFTDVYTNFSSFLPLEHKFGLTYRY